mmetsp:Transcript_4727/g.10938  ORF Transcript_4727/g.10938 Transcript_4727/m.10938 type:complete len:100 (-) Transcript_4727:320-619(-)
MRRQQMRRYPSTNTRAPKQAAATPNRKTEREPQFSSADYALKTETPFVPKRRALSALPPSLSLSLCVCVCVMPPRSEWISKQQPGHTHACSFSQSVIKQ